jgi:hypothetical protein
MLLPFKQRHHQLRDNEVTLQQDIKPPPMMPLTPTSQMPMGYPNYSWYQSDTNMNQHQGLLT